MEETSTESEEFIEDIVGQSLNHLVKESSTTKGIVNITVNTNGTYNIVLHKGTDNKPVRIESVGKEKLIRMLEGKL